MEISNSVLDFKNSFLILAGILFIILLIGILVFFILEYLHRKYLKGIKVNIPLGHASGKSEDDLYINDNIEEMKVYLRNINMGVDGISHKIERNHREVVETLERLLKVIKEREKAKVNKENLDFEPENATENNQESEVVVSALPVDTSKENIIENEDKDENRDVSNLASIGFESADYLDFYMKYVAPNENKIKGYKALKELMLLIDNKGDCPSVVQDKEGTSFQKGASKRGNITDYDILAKVSLRTHTLHVAEETIKILEEKFDRIHPNTALPYLFCAFGHDLGKLEYFYKQRGKYVSLQHPEISVAEIEKFLEKAEFDNDKKKEILEAILNHHNTKNQTNNNYDLEHVLKEADKRARRREIGDYLAKTESGSSSILLISDTLEAKILGKGPDDNYLDLPFKIWEEVFETISSMINVVNKNKLEVFTFRGKLYLEASLIYNLTVNNKNVNLPDIFYSNNEEDIIKAKLLIIRALVNMKLLDQSFSLDTKKFYGKYMVLVTNKGKEFCSLRIVLSFQGVKNLFPHIDFSNYPPLPVSLKQVEVVKNCKELE